jgi:hypothetical protein
MASPSATGQAPDVACFSHRGRRPRLREQLAARIGGWLGDQARRVRNVLTKAHHARLHRLGRRAVVSVVDELAAGIACAPSVLSFDALEHWRKPRVACLTASVIPAPLRSLVAGLEAALDAAGVGFDRRPYRTAPDPCSQGRPARAHGPDRHVCMGGARVCARRGEHARRLTL